MKVIIPVAGYATRLYPLTENVPKAMLDINGRPILEHVIAKVMELPVDEIVVVSNDKFYRHFLDGCRNFRCNVPVRVLNDGTSSNDDRLGQIGDILFALDSCPFDDDLLVIAGDNLFNFSLVPAFELMKEKGAVVNGLFDVDNVESAKQLGTALVNQHGVIVDFQEKSQTPKSTLASMGIYFFPKEKVSLIRDYLAEGNPADKMGYFMAWLTQCDTVFGKIYKEAWFDIGWLESLEQARREFRE